MKTSLYKSIIAVTLVLAPGVAFAHPAQSTHTHESSVRTHESSVHTHTSSVHHGR